jgi:hypothetical protein
MLAAAANAPSPLRIWFELAPDRICGTEIEKQLTCVQHDIAKECQLKNAFQSSLRPKHCSVRETTLSRTECVSSVST